MCATFVKQKMGANMKGEDRYLLKRGKHWHYVRRVPSSCRGVDHRRFVRVTLGTKSIELARETPRRPGSR